MGIKRYELGEAQWEGISGLLPGKAGDPGRTGSDNRLFVNGCLWVLRSGAHWRDLPERYGKWKTVHRRFSRWCHAGVWERVFEICLIPCFDGALYSQEWKEALWARFYTGGGNDSFHELTQGWIAAL